MAALWQQGGTLTPTSLSQQFCYFTTAVVPVEGYIQKQRACLGLGGPYHGSPELRTRLQGVRLAVQLDFTYNFCPGEMHPMKHETRPNR